MEVSLSVVSLLLLPLSGVFGVGYSRQQAESVVNLVSTSLSDSLDPLVEAQITRKDMVCVCVCVCVCECECVFTIWTHCSLLIISSFTTPFHS